MFTSCLHVLADDKRTQNYSNQPFEINISVSSLKVFNADLIKQLTDSLEEQRQTNQTLKQFTELNQIMRYEENFLDRALRSKGFYNASISSEFVNSKKIIYKLSSGKQFHISNIELHIDKRINRSKLPKLEISENQPLIAAKVLSSIDQLKAHILRYYCFYEVKLEYRAILDRQSQTARLIIDMLDSEETKFGTTALSGADSIAVDYLETFINHKQGECFSRLKIEQTRFALLRSNLLSSVHVDIGKIDNGRVHTKYEVKERHHRTVKAGIGYSTDEQLYVTSGWEHQNFLGEGQKFRVNSRASAIRQNLLVDYTIPKINKEDQTLTLFNEIQNEDLDSYQSLSYRLGLRLHFNPHQPFNYASGAELKASKVEDQASTEEFYLLSFPLEANLDRTNDILDPKEGFLLTASIRPYVDIANTDITFLKTLLSASVYHTFDLSLQPTLAARYSIGAIFGESLQNIPADERFYVGGGGSVRGYAYQSLSRIDAGDPRGGTSFQEVNSELRVRFLENWGLATFVGGGFAFDKTLPSVDQRILWAAGLGLRYYTSFAPFRLDLAFPLNRRNDYDDNFQIYISIGQAF